jgi:hypothetical protein
MTVDELINELNKVKDKSKDVCFLDNQWGTLLVRKVSIEENWTNEPVLLKS